MPGRRGIEPRAARAQWTSCEDARPFAHAVVENSSGLAEAGLAGMERAWYPIGATRSSSSTSSATRAIEVDWSCAHGSIIATIRPARRFGQGASQAEDRTTRLPRRLERRHPSAQRAAMTDRPGHSRAQRPRRDLHLAATPEATARRTPLRVQSHGAPAVMSVTRVGKVDARHRDPRMGIGPYGQRMRCPRLTGSRSRAGSTSGAGIEVGQVTSEDSATPSRATSSFPPLASVP
jgi:hypothetical protein